MTFIEIKGSGRERKNEGTEYWGRMRYREWRLGDRGLGATSTCTDNCPVWEDIGSILNELVVDS